jgi:hypothetical protein
MRARSNSISSKARQSRIPREKRKRMQLYFAVAIGRKTGVFLSATEAREQVNAVSMVCTRTYGTLEPVSGGSQAKTQCWRIVPYHRGNGSLWRSVWGFQRYHSYLMFFSYFFLILRIVATNRLKDFRGLTRKLSRRNRKV